MNFSINTPEPGKTYAKRPGAYAIMPNDQGLLAIIKTNKGYFLPGGGIEKDESEKNCIIRECKEEVGLQVQVLEKICSSTYFFYSPGRKMNIEIIGHFYYCQIKKVLDIASEADHELVWLSPEEAIKLLYLENQKQAVKIFLEK